MYDLIVQNGIVIDPQTGPEKRADIYVKDGRIASPPTTETALVEGVRTINATGCYVSPGLIDAHAHVNPSSNELGIRADLICPPSGVTTVIDPGSAGLCNFKAFYEHEIMPSATRIRAAISPTKFGVQVGRHEEIPDPQFGRPEALRPFFEQYGDVLVGIKQRVNQEVTGSYGLKGLEQSAKTAQTLRAEGHRCQLMVHFGPLASGIKVAEVLDLLGAGDVLTHMYRPDRGTSLFDAAGKVLECAVAAQKRGVIFETGCARGHLSLQQVRRGLAQEFRPQIISSDIVNFTAFYPPSGWLMLKMTIYLNAGLSLREVVKAVTTTPAQVWGLEKEAGSLAVGQPADIAIFRVQEEQFTIPDLYGETLPCDQLLVPMATVKGGQVVFQQIFLR